MKNYTLQLLLLLCSATIISCGTQPKIPSDGSSNYEPIEIIRPPVTEKQATLSEEANYYADLAEDANSEEERQSYHAKAGKLFLDAGNLAQAKQQLHTLEEYTFDDTRPALTNTTILLLTAEIATAEKNIVLANELISKINPISSRQKIAFLELKANYDHLSADFMSAVKRRVELDAFLPDEKSRNKNSQQIWISLSSMPISQLQRQRSNNSITAGWLDLAKLMRSGQKNISQLENNLLDWGTNNPTHPFGNNFLSDLIDNYQSDSTTRKHIAVLLPMQGSLSKVTATIKNGFLSAYYNDQNSFDKPKISFYDSSNELVTFQQLYQQAISDGATNVIGPIDKITINQLAQQSELDIPVLTLNYAENNSSQTDNLFQFGLSPEDEARQVAELAIKQNKLRAAVFYPDSKWGKRLHYAFKHHYEALGGEILTAKDYATDSNDFRRPIRTLLNLDQSAIRRTRVENILGQRVQSEPYRRQDIDMIFLAATHRSARGIMPAFKFHHAGDLPVYATSHVYTGSLNRELDRDLNGIIFCDLPWVLQNTSPLNKKFKQNWPQQENLTRLFALGADAYHLIYNLNYLASSDYAFYDGHTGNIQLNSANRITRKLLWAKFKRGRAVPFKPIVDIPQLSTNDTSTINH